MNYTTAIGKKFVFGVFHPLPNGYLIEPICRTILQTGGKVEADFTYPLDRAWVPYLEGFALAPSLTSPIVSSTWREERDGMFIGYYNGDKLMPHQLVLVPQVLQKIEPVYVIASCEAYFTRTVFALAHQLIGLGIPKSRIKAVVSNCKARSESTVNGIELIFTDHNAFEFTALYEAPRHWSADYFTMIHDTVEIEDGFRSHVEHVNMFQEWEQMPFTPIAICVMGTYKREFLVRENDFLRQLHGIPKTVAIMLETGGELLMRAKTAYTIGRNAEWMPDKNPFGTEITRVERYFRDIRLRKYSTIHYKDPNLNREL